MHLVTKGNRNGKSTLGVRKGFYCYHLEPESTPSRSERGKEVYVDEQEASEKVMGCH